MTSFYSERAIKATRKAAVCSGCGRKIEIGSPALRYSGVFDGDFASHIHHPECRAAEIELNRLHDVRDGDDWMALTDMECDDWPWLIETYPVIAERMGITQERYDNHVAEQEACRKAWAETGWRRNCARAALGRIEGEE